MDTSKIPADHQEKLKKFLLSVSQEDMMGILERAMRVFAQGQSVYNAMHFSGFEPIYESDVGLAFDIMRELFLKPKPFLEPGEPSPLGGIAGNASAVWMKWYRTKHGVSLSESREAGIKRRAEFCGEYTGAHVSWPAV
jgi:hypothetical protein